MTFVIINWKISLIAPGNTRIKIFLERGVPHACEQIAREGLVHASLDRVWASSCVSLREVQIELTNRASAGLDTQ